MKKTAQLNQQQDGLASISHGLPDCVNTELKPASASGQATMSSREIAELTGKNHADVLRDIRAMLTELQGEGGTSKFADTYQNEQNGQTYPLFNLDREHSLCLVAGYSVAMRMAIIKRWQELETKQAMPLPQTYIGALKALIEAEEAKEVALLLAQHAIETKAEIGSRREATAMNTASQAVKKAAALEIELDQSKQYATIKRMQLLHHGLCFKWRDLKSASAEMDLPPINIFDANYGTVKAYHADVWRECYALSIEQDREAEQ